MGAASEAASLDLWSLGVGLVGGLAIFLFGIGQMTDGLKAAAGAGMRSLLNRLTTNRFAGALTGAVVTAIIQSSSVTTVLVVGFISSGLMTLQQSIGVIMGANIGTTVTAQIIAFKVTAYALVLVSIGFGLMFFWKRDRVRQIGAVFLGLGFIFLGMDLMSEATYPLRDHQPFIDLMTRLDAPIWGVLAGAVFTAMVQSSSATTGIVIMLASQGFITLEAGIALALGANIGTCVTAALSALGKPIAAKQAALVHLIFNIAGAAMWLGLIGVLATTVRAISPSDPSLEGVARLAAETPRQIANAHTLFNVANTLVFIWFTAPLAWIVRRVVRERPKKKHERLQPAYLDAALIQTPALAVERVRLEVGHLGEQIELALATVVRSEVSRRVEAPALRRHLEDASALSGAIVDYVRQLYRVSLNAGETEELQLLLSATNHLVSIADTLALNWTPIMERVVETELHASPETRQLFVELRDLVHNAVRESIEAVRSEDVELARAVIDRKPVIGVKVRALDRHLKLRLGVDDPRRLEKYRLETEAMEVLRRLYYFAKRIAKTVDEPEEIVEHAPATPEI